LAPAADLEELANRSAMPESSWAELDARPAIVPWRRLRNDFIEAVAAEFSGWISPDQPHFRDQLLVAVGRFDHGVRLLYDVVPPVAGPLRVLDIGSGNGGVSLAFANDPNHIVYGLDLVPNVHARSIRQRIPVPIVPVVGDGSALPFASDSLDLVLLIDVLEHMRAPREAAVEIMRVLRPGGRCILLTPPRIPLLFRPDPHYGIRGLLLFPNGVQRQIVNRLFRRRIHTPSGDEQPAYDVEHIYWHPAGIARLFPGPKTVDVLYDRAFHPPGGFRWWMIRRPEFAWNEIRYRLRRWSFGHLIIHKGELEEGTTYDRM
jgi:SAM-dependent methyltransferase